MPFETRINSPIPSRRRSSGIMFAGNQCLVLLNLIRNLIMIPLYLKYVSVQEFGAWLAFSSVVSIMAMADLGLNNLIIQKTANLYGAGKIRLLGHTVISLLTTVSLLAGTLLAAAWLLIPFVIGLMNSWKSFEGVLILPFRLAVLDSALMLLVFGSGGILLGLQRPLINMAAIIGSQMVGIITTLMALTWGMGLLAIPFGMVIGTAVALLITTAALYRVVKPILPPGSMHFNWVILREMLGESSMVFLVRVSNILTTRSSAMLIAAILSTPLVVVFELTRKASLLISDVVSRLPMSLLPALSHMAGTGEREKMVRVVSLLFQMTLMVSILGAGGIVLFNQDFVRLWTGSQYYGGNYLNMILSLSAVVQLLNSAASNVNFANGRLKTIVRASLTEGFFHIALIAVLGFWLGLPGVAAGILLAAFASLLIQGSGVLNLFELYLDGNRWIRRGLWIVLLGIMPVILEVFILKMWMPRSWTGLGLLGVSYLVLAGTIFLLFDGSTRMAVLEKLPKNTKWFSVSKIFGIGFVRK
jgi:O-antigen/teichoic acid export membrane protein